MLKPKFSSFSLAVEGRENSDAMASILLKDGRVFAAIADGVGSAKYGGEAARLAVITATQFAETYSITDIYRAVSEKIKAASVQESGQWSSTLSVCLLSDGYAEIGHVGDTRIYHLRGTGLQTRTRDQTEVERLIEEGVLTRERALRYPRRNVLISAMNGNGDYTLQTSGFDVQERDRILLLSDGVYKQVSKRKIIDMSNKNSEIDAFIEELKLEVLNRGIVDDSTVLCIELS